MTTKLPMRRIYIVFSAIMFVMTLELAWWITFQLRSSAQQEAHYVDDLADKKRLATAMINLALAANPRQDPAQVLSIYFSDLAWQDDHVIIQQDALAPIVAKHQAHLRMFLSEGSFFLVMVLIGGVLVFRALKRDIALIRQQQNFLSAVTHEFKSPLAAIKLYAETMQLRDVAPLQRDNYLNAITADVARLDSLVNNILAVTRLEADKFVLHAGAIDLGAEMQAIVQHMQHIFSNKDAVITYVVQTANLYVHMDPAVLRTILGNLLDNAIKYSAQATPASISIIITGDAEHATIEIADKGIGIAKEEQKKIFEKFYRVGDEMTRQTTGSGLGLYLVACLMKLMHGRVWVHSDGLSCGATFYLCLPRTHAQEHI